MSGCRKAAPQTKTVQPLTHVLHISIQLDRDLAEQPHELLAPDEPSVPLPRPA